MKDKASHLVYKVRGVVDRNLTTAEHRWVVCAPYNEGRCVLCGQSHSKNGPFKTDPIDCKTAQQISMTHDWDGDLHKDDWECKVCGTTCPKQRHVPYHEKSCAQVLMEEALT